MDFKELHVQDDPLLICNVWDVASAEEAERLGFKALGTSSAAVAAMFGYDDGEEIGFSELEYVVGRIVARTSLPLSVDIESGYGRNPQQIVDNISSLADMGVVGINIEDSTTGGERKLMEAEGFARRLSIIRESLERMGVMVFLNVRTDVFLLGHAEPVGETKKRGRIYADAGADGIFVPCLERESDIKAVVESTLLPVNVMCMPHLPPFDRLKSLGVKRVSMGDFLFRHLREHFGQVLGSVLDQGSFQPVFQS